MAPWLSTNSLIIPSTISCPAIYVIISNVVNCFLYIPKCPTFFIRVPVSSYTKNMLNCRFNVIHIHEHLGYIMSDVLFVMCFKHLVIYVAHHVADGKKHFRIFAEHSDFRAYSLTFMRGLAFERDLMVSHGIQETRELMRLGML